MKQEITSLKKVTQNEMMTKKHKKISIALKKDGKSQYAPKRYLLWKLNDLLNIANRSSPIKNRSSFVFSFGKKIKFHQL